MKKKLIPIILCLVLALVFFAEYLHSKYGLTTTHYTISAKNLTDSIRIVQLSDLHNSVFGDNNKRLIAAVADVSPDLILITGDLVNSHEGSDITIATNLISDMSSIAPVYFSYGNQEKDMELSYGTNITSLYTLAGATVLEYSYEDLEIKEQHIRLGGIYGYCQTEAYAVESHREDESDFLREFQDSANYCILMCHMPVCWITANSLYDWNIDTVFSGHSHGGQIRIPFVGGLWAPDQGWLPGKMCGIYKTNEKSFDQYKKKIHKWLDDMKKSGNPITVNTSKYEDDTFWEYSPSYLVLSRGLGNTEKVPRFNNVPEIVIVDLIPEED